MQPSLAPVTFFAAPLGVAQALGASRAPSDPSRRMAIEEGHAQDEPLPGFENIATAKHRTRSEDAGVRIRSRFQRNASAASDALAAIASSLDPGVAATVP